jgi:hypothetical protein
MDGRQFRGRDEEYGPCDGCNEAGVCNSHNILSLIKNMHPQQRPENEKTEMKAKIDEHLQLACSETSHLQYTCST